MKSAPYRHYAIRDVEDVEAHVRRTASSIAVEGPDECERLVARGMLLVQRIASALAPETSLATVLWDVLPTALAVYQRRESTERRKLARRRELAPRRAA